MIASRIRMTNIIHLASQMSVMVQSHYYLLLVMVSQYKILHSAQVENRV
jgi:hypothetical protein